MAATVTVVGLPWAVLRIGFYICVVLYRAANASIGTVAIQGTSRMKKCDLLIAQNKSTGASKPKSFIVV